MAPGQLASSSAVQEQVCDRCRRRKIRCHGDCDECSPCLAAGVACVRATKLQRNRKRKSFYENERIEQPSTRTGPGSQASDPSPSTLTHDGASPSPRSDFSGLRPPAAPRGIPSQGPPSTCNSVPQFQAGPRHEKVAVMSTTSTKSTRSPAAEPVVGHMGRLVSGDGNVAMFAGSTTGVHFVSQAEQKVQMLQIHGDMFPHCAYSLHLHDPRGGVSSSADSLTPDTAFVQAAVAQMPIDATDIISATIDRWTPIYPIVHKPTTMEALRGLMDVSSPPGSDAVVTLYQALGLLALGSIGKAGQCARDHRHVFCLSEGYYSISASVIDKVLARPCLQALQGLEIVQIYLQISSRHAVASHMGGIATRLAQSLGLHRHSHRFKFDPLETELRRRAWWCQFSLDTFSSALHGLPRLIRDQDVDTDLPTNTDHDLLSRSHVSLPLPGERSQVDSALCLFKLARIVGETLENLYTTTRRRGGVGKISRLNAELDMWQHSLPGGPSSHFTGEGDHGPGLNSGDRANGGETAVIEGDGETNAKTLSASKFATTFLRIASCIARIHVHRPALSFIGPDPQFTTSLRACVCASKTLIRIMSAVLDSIFERNPGRDEEAYQSNGQRCPAGLILALLYPNGPHMLWQAGLTILYSRWKAQHGTPPLQGNASMYENGISDGVNSSSGDEEELVRRCAATLRQLRDVTSSRDSTSMEGDQLGQCADVLDLLRGKTWIRATAATGTSRAGQEAEDKEDRVEWEEAIASAQVMSFASDSWTQQQQQQQLSWNVWDWPMESALELANSMDATPMDFFIDGFPAQ